MNSTLSAFKLLNPNRRPLSRARRLSSIGPFVSMIYCPATAIVAWTDWYRARGEEEIVALLEQAWVPAR